MKHFSPEEERQILTIITFAGEATRLLAQAFEACRKGDYAACDALMDESDDAMDRAHSVQTQLIQQEMRGEPVELSLLMIHAQDHIMNAVLMRQVMRYLIQTQKDLEEKSHQGGIL